MKRILQFLGVVLLALPDAPAQQPGRAIPADTLFKQAGDLMDRENFPEAIAVLSDLTGRISWMEHSANARKTYNNLGYSYYLSQNYPESAQNYERAVFLAQELRDTTKWITSQISLAMAYRQLGLYGRCLEANQEALQLARQTGDWESEANILNAMGITYQNLADWDKAIDFHREGLNRSYQHGDTLMASYLMSNIAISQAGKGKIDSSLIYNLQSLRIKQTLMLDSTAYVKNYQNIGDSYLDLDSLQLASDYLAKAEELYSALEDKKGLVGCYSSLARLYLARSLPSEAEKYLLQAEALLQSVTVKNLQIEYLTQKVDLLERKGDFPAALTAFKELTSLREEVFQSEQLEVQRVESAYALREKELVAQRLAQDAALVRAQSRKHVQLLVFLGVSLLAAILITLFFSRLNRRLAESNQHIQMQKLELKHTTYNLLMRIQSLLRMTAKSIPDPASKEKLQQIESAVLSAASLQQFTYGVEKEDEVSLGEYLEELINRLKEAFDTSGFAHVNYEVRIKEDAFFPVNTLLNCGMIVAEIVTNAIKYAFTNVPEPRISVSLAYEGPFLLLQIGDNGVGMDRNVMAKGIGIDLIGKLARSIKADLAVNSEGGTWYTLKIRRNRFVSSV
ncbi:sensory transduction histidine kinase [Lunatimonas lonarensis]|uniref:Sensory transduction histidine kinase n=1 Tax=Lunatimonas lonarensis TaxID=1232681 RepID=R7ZRI5_9BACT|nr:tetratricopeptide repeat protein [Lunatimonas lonarensis]EON76771.1 sensory transduction histidine kinase [Lunatimonas lonarensis]